MTFHYVVQCCNLHCFALQGYRGRLVESKRVKPPFRNVSMFRHWKMIFFNVFFLLFLWERGKDIGADRFDILFPTTVSLVS